MRYDHEFRKRSDSDFEEGFDNSSQLECLSTPTINANSMNMIKNMQGGDDRYGNYSNIFIQRHHFHTGSNNKQLRFSSNNKEQVSFKFISMQSTEQKYQDQHTAISKYLSKDYSEGNSAFSEDKNNQNNDEEKEKDGKNEKKNTKKKKVFSPEDYINSMAVKTKRVEIGENLSINYSCNQSKKNKLIKNILAQNQNYSIVYEENQETCSHSYFKKFYKSKNSTFLSSKYNRLIKQKLSKNYFQMSSERNISLANKSETQMEVKYNNLKKLDEIKFLGDFECGNLDFVIKKQENQYDLYLRIDTNTYGHENWFNFKMKNISEESKNIKINICNLKRGFRMIKYGQKIHYRKHKICNTNIMNPEQQQKWQALQVNTIISQNKQYNELSNSLKKAFKIQFEIIMQENYEYQISLIPPYTYSELLKDIENYQKQSEIVVVDILTYSLTGLAIPILTIGKDSKIQKHKIEKKNQKEDNQKKVILISCRIHPSETCSSFIMNGLIKKLLQKQNVEVKQFLQKNVIKIIPMLNPDGVIFGNFRTNFLGEDLNRSFDRIDETLYPETTALKEYGKMLKLAYQQNFIAFIDLHGHSSQSNIFSYGPEHDTSSKQKYFLSRILPKILDKSTQYFKYDKCTFKLEEYKNNTARGYFLSKLNVMAYTIEASYGLGISKQNQNINKFTVQSWQHFGGDLAKALCIYGRCLEELEDTKNKIKIKNISSKNEEIDASIDRIFQNNFMKNLQKQIKAESITVNTHMTVYNKQKSNQIQKLLQNQSQEQSDGDDPIEDLPLKQKQILFKKVKEIFSPNFYFPRILHPAIVHPAVIKQSDTKNQILTQVPKLSVKIRKNTHKIPRIINANNEYTQYLLKNVEGLSSLKPQIIKFAILCNKKSATKMNKINLKIE